MRVEHGHVGLLLLHILLSHTLQGKQQVRLRAPRSGPTSICQDGAVLRGGGQVGRLTEQLKPHDVPVRDEEVPVDAAIRAEAVQVGELPPDTSPGRLHPRNLAVCVPSPRPRMARVSPSSMWSYSCAVRSVNAAPIPAAKFAAAMSSPRVHPVRPTHVSTKSSSATSVKWAKSPLKSSSR